MGLASRYRNYDRDEIAAVPVSSNLVSFPNPRRSYYYSGRGRKANRIIGAAFGCISAAGMWYANAMATLAFLHSTIGMDQKYDPLFWFGQFAVTSFEVAFMPTNSEFRESPKSHIFWIGVAVFDVSTSFYGIADFLANKFGNGFARGVLQQGTVSLYAISLIVSMIAALGAEPLFWKFASMLRGY